MTLEILKCIQSLLQCLQALINGSPGIVWGILFILALQVAKSHAAPMNGTNTQVAIMHLLSAQDSNSSFVLYSINAMESTTYTFALDEIHQESSSGINDLNSAENEANGSADKEKDQVLPNHSEDSTHPDLT